MAQRCDSADKFDKMKFTYLKIPIQQVKCHLVGDFEGKVFDDREVEFNLGEGEELGIIEGVEHGIERMGLGEVARFAIDAKYAFGSAGKKEFNITPNSSVTYRVTLKEFEKAPDSWKLDADESLKQAILL